MNALTPELTTPLPSPRQRVSFNDNWRFLQDDGDADREKLGYRTMRGWLMPSGNPFREAAAEAPAAAAPTPAYSSFNYDDSAWRQLTLPHDWGIEGPFRQEYPGETGKLPWWGVSWYRKSFTLPAGAEDSRFYLDFDGAMSHAAVWVNGRFAGGWPYGYASFRVDLTPYLKIGDKNVVAVRLDNPPESSRWYPGGGIYRNVWLVRTGPVHVCQWGAFVTTPQVSPEAATASVRVRVENHRSEDCTVSVQTSIYPLAERDSAAPVARTPPQIAIIPASAATVCASSAKIPSPALWSLEQPNLYVAVTSIERDGVILDRYETVFGIRTIRFDAEEGFFLNGQNVPMKGVCQHHDLGALGAAVNPRALERQVELLREMGANAIRTSHNPPAPELLDLCDRMGMLVIDEAFDAWAMEKRPNDYSRLFPDWHEADLRAFVRRDRNRPCVVMWSTGNEIREQGDEEGFAVSRNLAAIVRSEDSTRPTTVGCNFPEAAYNGFQETMDVFGFNYKPHEYGPFREKHPHIPCYGSETASTISSRGEYFFPVSDEKSGGQANFQMSSYDLYAPRWAMPPDPEFAAQERFPFVFGEFVWTGFDYLGEPTPYNTDSSTLLNFSDPAERERAQQELAQLGKLQVPSRSSYFGILDLAGFKKDRFFLYQAHWRPDLPMAHILPHWNWPERIGEVTPVFVYTSGDEAELFLNGRSLGRKTKKKLTYRIRWDDVVYEPGELKVVAYRNGDPWAEALQRTAGPAAALRLKADRSTIRGDGCDLSFVTLSIVDSDSLVVPRSNNRITFSLSGPGEIVATDNGDATSHEPFQSPIRKAYNSLALAIVRALPGEGGEIRLRAESEGLEPAELVIRTAP